MTDASRDYVDSHYARSLAEPGDYAGLDGDVDVETCVIGGGLAGLATALDLAERGRSVALLEGARIGWGASGRNGGFVSPGFPNGYPALVEAVGLRDARELSDMSRAAHARLRARIDEYAIDCGPVENGALRCAMAESPGTLEAFCADMARDFGLEYEYWPRARVGAALATTRYGDAFFNPYSFRVHPLNLSRGHARAIVERGGRVHEHTRATRIVRDRGRLEVRTRRGTVRADHVVIACGGYVGALDWTVSMATIPIATFVMVTEPLGSRLADAIRVPYAISDIKFATNYYRPLADGRLLWGGRVLAWEPDRDRIAALLSRDMAAFYPSLAGARVETAWGGKMPYTRDKMPVVGRLPSGVWYATGFGGLGMSLTTLAGQLIGSAIADADDRWRLLARFGLPFAGGHLGRVPAQVVYWRKQLAGARGGRMG